MVKDVYTQQSENKSDGRSVEVGCTTDSCLWLFLYRLDVGGKTLVNKWEDSSSCNRGSHESIEFFVASDSKL